MTFEELLERINVLEEQTSNLQQQNIILQQQKSSIEQQKLSIEEQKSSIEEHNLELESQNSNLKKQQHALEIKVGTLQFQVDQLRRLLFGAKRERFISNQQYGQMSLPFDLPQEQEPQRAIQEITYTREKKTRKEHPGRTPLPDHLPVEEIIIEPNEDVSDMKCIGKEVTDKLEYKPAKLYIKRYIRPRYIKPEDDLKLNFKGVIAELPTFPIEKGIAGASLLAQIMVDKYVDHLPIHRQIQRFKREKINIPSNTINGWQNSISQLLLPLHQKHVRLILKQGYLQVDETPIKVLDSSIKGKTHQGYYWVYNAPMQNAVFYDYRKGRGREGPKEMLANFKGYIQSDGYQVYEWFGKQEDITLLNCWAHARRYFEKATTYHVKDAEYVMVEIQKLYAVERFAKLMKLTYDQRKELRLDHALPILNELGKWMAQNVKNHLPKSPMGEALQYTINRWDNLLTYLYDGALEIDNNLVENAIRPNALGRKNYLFAGSHECAQRAAMFYSFFGTCKRHNINPYNWLKKVLEIIPDYPANKLEDLLPQNLSL